MRTRFTGRCGDELQSNSAAGVLRYRTRGRHLIVCGCRDPVASGEEEVSHVVSVEGGPFGGRFRVRNCRFVDRGFVCVAGSESVCSGPASNLSTARDTGLAASSFRELVRDFAKFFAKSWS